jgi:hypothetical protein
MYFKKKKNVTLLVMVLVLSMLLTACGKSEAVKNVEAEISALETITVDSKADIEQIQADYDALSDKEKGQVDNLDTLDEAKQVVDVETQIADVVAEPTEDTVSDVRTAYDSLGESAQEKVTNYADLESVEATLALCKKITDAASGRKWYYNGGSKTKLNSIYFRGTSAFISQVYFDGNGKHSNGGNTYRFTADENKIKITLDNGTTLKIPYRIKKKKLILGSGDYYTSAEVKAEIQGCWKLRTYGGILIDSANEYNVCFKKGKIISESAAKKYGGFNGEYYYYGPYKGKYTLNFGGFDTNLDTFDEWFFNIINGKVKILHYDEVCKRTKSLPGKNGYSF